MATETGKIKYEARAFQQDAQLAMSGDPLKALIELITNADDAYERKTQTSEIEQGTITIKVPESLKSVPTSILITQLSLSKETSISGSIESAFASCFASSMSSSDGFDPTIVTQPLPTDFSNGL